MQKTQKNPTVSITLCTYNSEKYLCQAIESILAQTYEDWELLILDDASTDTTSELVKRYLKDERIIYVQHISNIGITKNRNYGLSISKGMYISVLDSDDVWIDKNKLQKQIEYLNLHPECVLIGTNMIVIDEHGKDTKRVCYAEQDTDIRKNILIKNQFAQSSVVFQKSAASACNNYDEHLFIWEDWDLWLRLGQCGTFHNLQIFSLRYRKHSKNVSDVNKKKGLDASYKIIRTYKNLYPNYWIGFLKLQIKKVLLTLNA